MIYGKISSAQLAGGINSNPPIIGRSIDSTLSGDIDVHNRLNYIEDHAVMPNMDFDNDWGWWNQVKDSSNSLIYPYPPRQSLITGNKRRDSILVHKRELTEQFDNYEVSPAIVTQTKVHYNDNVGRSFTRMCNAYHELIGDGSVVANDDHHTPNFTAMGATCYNKFRGNVGMAAVIGRIEDVAYTDEELGISANDTKGKTGLGSSKSCAGGFMVTRRSNYSQGRHNASYSIGLETYTLNAAEEDGILGTEGYASNDDFHRHRTWINGYHCVGGGRRPATDGILINGFTVTVPIDADGKTTSDSNAVKRVTMHNGFLNGITIGGTSMAVRHIVKVTDADGTELSGYTTDGNSVETVGINTSSWSKSDGKNYGFYLLKHGYSPRILHSRGAALFEVPGAKFFNSTGSMPFAISCVNEYTYKDEQQVEHTAHGVPYLDFKIGSSSDFFQNNKPVERPTDTTRSRIGYVSTSNSMNVSSDGGIKFNVNRNFSSASTTGKIYTMTSTDFSPTTPLKLGNIDSKWETVYSKMGAVNAGDETEIKANPVVIENGDSTDEKTKILTAWGNIRYKIFEFSGTSTIKHFGLVAQDIIAAFSEQGLNAVNYGIVEAKTENNVTTYSIRYNECLALECAYLRYIYSSRSA